MSVVLPFPVGDVETQAELPSYTYRLDFDKGRIIGKVDDIEAVNQAIHKALVTSRFRCLIYDNQYGSELKETIIAGDATPEYVETEIPRLVKDALAPETRILDVYDFTVRISDEKVYINFKANTIFGETAIEEVI